MKKTALTRARRVRNAWAHASHLNRVQKKEVKRLIKVRQELKYVLTNVPSVSMSLTAVCTGIIAIPQGDTDNERTGDRIMYAQTGHLFRGICQVGDQTNYVRFIVFQWKPNSTPTASSILLNGPSGSVDVFSHYSHDNRQEYRVMYDRLFVLGGSGLAAGNPTTSVSNLPIKFRLKMPNKQVQFVAGSSTVGTNLIYYIGMADSSVLPHPSINGQFKLFYYDA